MTWVLILGAAKDKTLPVELSRKLAAGLTASGRDVTYVEFPDGNHISIPTQSNYRAVIDGFVSRLDKDFQTGARLNIGS